MEYTVAAVREALSVLMIIAHNPGLGVTEISKRSGNTKARTFRMLATLEQASFVQRDTDATTYSLGPIALVLGLAAREQVGVTKLASRYLESLQAEFNETVAVVVRDELEAVTVAQNHSTHDVRVQTPLGRRRALHAGASGKVLLAFASAEVRNAVLDGELERFSPGTITSKTKLKQELKRVFEQGYAQSNGEVAADVVAVAAPIFYADGQVLATLSMSIPVGRVPADMSVIIQKLVKSANSLSEDLGYKEMENRLS